MTSSSTPRRRAGSQEPTRRADPEAFGSEWAAFKAVADAARFELFDWQVAVGRQWSATREDGRWAAGTCGLSIPRQNGKTVGCIGVRAVGGCILKNEQVLYTSQLQSTSRETFEEWSALVETRGLRKYLKAIRGAIGRESIEFKNGSRIKFMARTDTGGRGKHCDLLVFDEAQCLTDIEQSSYMPAQSASANPQTLYVGTPPDERSPGDAFRRVRDGALSHAPRTAWAEWGASEIGDASDRDRWYATNPSLGLLILEETVEIESTSLTSDRFARERLGWWSKPAEIERVIAAKAWARCRDERPWGEAGKPPADGWYGVGVKFSVDGRRASLACCLRSASRAPHVEVVKSLDTSRGTRRIAQWILGHKDKVALALVDGKRGEAVLQALSEERFPKGAAASTKSPDMAKANAAFVDAVNSCEVTHFGQPALDDAATLCPRRKLGADGFGFDDAPDADSTLIEACALAYRAAMTAKRNPNRKLRVG